LQTHHPQGCIGGAVCGFLQGYTAAVRGSFQLVLAGGQRLAGLSSKGALKAARWALIGEA